MNTIIENTEQKKTPGQELSDLFYALQITTKIVDGILLEYKSESRTQEDYDSRIQSQINILLKNMRKIKPITEKLVEECYSYIKREEESSKEDL